jgi:hypothetical protein
MVTVPCFFKNIFIMKLTIDTDLKQVIIENDSSVADFIKSFCDIMDGGYRVINATKEPTCKFWEQFPQTSISGISFPDDV